jgi:bifunctional non-homologous end joining protein LigD
MGMAKSKSIEDYEAKRDFEKTPEPPPGGLRDRSGSRVFVVHRHEARRLHYDLRLEMEGALKSWAVPKGFSYDPAVKRLAVRTEDHPLEYEHFEGVIPKDSYGAGTMTIWDRGHYVLPKGEDGVKKVAEGKLEIVFFGQKLRGEWHLVRTKKEKDEWILFKSKDRYARAESEPAPFFNLERAHEGPIPEGVVPMEPGEVAAPFSDPGWLFEMKLAGLRVLAAKRGDRVHLQSKADEDVTSFTPEIVEELLTLRVENALLDGVLVALDEGRRPSQERLERFLEGESKETVYFYAIDLLYYEDWDIRDLPLVERKTILASVVPKLTHVPFVDHVQGRGEELHEMTVAAGLRGVIAKDPSGTYDAGPSPSWRDIPAHASEDNNDRDVLEALSLAAPRKTERTIKYTNLDKIFWPREGYTKGDLIAYYEQVADWLLPYLQERPIHMLRYPDGIEGKLFYQKNAPDHVPDWIDKEHIDSESRGEPIRYIICNDRATLLYMINLGSIDLHPWFSRRGSLEKPDWAILDLDPKEAPFTYVVKVARTLGKLLRGIGLRPYLKTSGKTGLHIYIPLRPDYTYQQTRTFCEGVARYVANEHKDIATVERVVSQRGKRVYIDYLQNHQGQTIVPPYVVRPVPGAWVSAPLDWDELDTELDPSQFTAKTMPERLSKLGDIFRGTLTDKQLLLPAIEELQKYLSNRCRRTT